MDPLIVWIDRLSAWASGPAVWGIFLSGAAIYLIASWRLRLVALLAQYFFIGIMFTRLFSERPEMALLKTLVGWLACAAIYLSARIRQESMEEEQRQVGRAADRPFRLVSLLMMTTIAYLASQHYALPFVSGDLALTCFLLLVLALLFIGTEQDVVVIGIGVLNLLAGLDIFYSVQDPGLLVTGLLIMVNLLVALAISYLTVVEVPE
ncbi:MAG: hypothetical protein ACP5HM_04390 [Anaerolineae bacterium]